MTECPTCHYLIVDKHCDCTAMKCSAPGCKGRDLHPLSDYNLCRDCYLNNKKEL